MSACSGARSFGVIDAQQRLVGYITAENLAELVMIRSARGAATESQTQRPAQA
jgi:hypothetical protein